MASDKDLTLAPLRCGLNVACLLRAGFGDRGLSGPSPLQELGLPWDGADALGPVTYHAAHSERAENAMTEVVDFPILLIGTSGR